MIVRGAGEVFTACIAGSHFSADCCIKNTDRSLQELLEEASFCLKASLSTLKFALFSEICPWNL
jgi:hypothetical protein